MLLLTLRNVLLIALWMLVAFGAEAPVEVDGGVEGS